MPATKLRYSAVCAGTPSGMLARGATSTGPSSRTRTASPGTAFPGSVPWQHNPRLRQAKWSPTRHGSQPAEVQRSRELALADAGYSAPRRTYNVAPDAQVAPLMLAEDA
ncbi:MAG TPA: hypothetical protein VGM14_13105 [Streptosporangiaceae bacterium]